MSDGIEVVRTGSRYHLVQLHVGAADATRRRCKDCAHMVGHVSWWCHNEDARKWHGTLLPHFANCKFWAPPPVKEPHVSLISRWFWFFLGLALFVGHRLRLKARRAWLLLMLLLWGCPPYPCDTHVCPEHYVPVIRADGPLGSPTCECEYDR